MEFDPHDEQRLLNTDSASNADTNTNTNVDSDSVRYTYSYTNTVGHTHSYTNTLRHTYSYTNTVGHTYSYSNTRAYGYANADPSPGAEHFYPTPGSNRQQRADCRIYHYRERAKERSGARNWNIADRFRHQ